MASVVRKSKEVLDNIESLHEQLIETIMENDVNRFKQLFITLNKCKGPLTKRTILNKGTLKKKINFDSFTKR